MSFQVVQAGLFLRRNWKVGAAISVALLVIFALFFGVGGSKGLLGETPAQASTEKDPSSKNINSGDKSTSDPATNVPEPADYNPYSPDDDYTYNTPDYTLPDLPDLNDNDDKGKKDDDKKDDNKNDDKKDDEPKEEDPKVEDPKTSDTKKNTPVKDIKDTVKNNVLDPVLDPLEPVKDVVDEVDTKVLEPVVGAVDPLAACISELTPGLQKLVKGLGVLDLNEVLKALDAATLLTPNADLDFQKCLKANGAL